MTKTITLDDKPLAIEGAETLGHVLAGAANHLQENDRIVVEVLVDGELLVGEDLQKRMDESASALDVRMSSANPRELTAAVLGQLRDALGDAGKLQEQAAEKLQTDHVEEARALLGESIDIWGKVQTGVQQTLKLMGEQVGDAITGEGGDGESGGAGESLNDAVVALTDQLRAVIEQLQNNDTLALADTLTYEWPAINERWDTLLGQLIATLEG